MEKDPKVQLITYGSGACLPTHRLILRPPAKQSGALPTELTGRRILNHIVTFVVHFFKVIECDFFAVSSNGEHIGFSLFQRGATSIPTMT